jgi:hypothetical protein
MKTKTFTSVILGIFALVLFLNLTSAALTSLTSVSVPTSIDRDAGSFDITFNVTAGTGDNINFVGSSTISGISFSFNPASLTFAADGSEQVKATVTFPSDLAEDSISGTINASDGTITKPLTFNDVSMKPNEISSCLITGDPNSDLEIRRIKFTNNGISETKFGSEDEWYILSDITADIDVRNRGNERIEDVEINWGLWDKDKGQWVIEPIDEDKFNLKSDKEETVTVKFNLEKDADVDLDELDDGDHYIFYVFANGFDNENDKDICVVDSEPVTIVVESDFVVLDNIDFPETVSCGDNFPITADVWNIGDSDQDDVYVKITNTELGIDERVDFNSINAFDFENMDVSIDVPDNAQEKTYYLQLKVYDENDDIYESDNDESSFLVPMTVSGNCASSSSGAKAVVSASLLSGGKAGENLVIKSTIFNSGTKSTTYTINAAGYSGWASSAQLSESTFTLNSGESKDITITLNVRDDASGDQSFNIEVVSGNQLVTTQPVSVSVESSGFFNGITGGSISGSGLIWGIGILNVILIVVIIIIAIRFASK